MTEELKPSNFKSLEVKLLPFYAEIRKEINTFKNFQVLKSNILDLLSTDFKTNLKYKYGLNEVEYLDFKAEVWPSIHNIIIKSRRNNENVDKDELETIIMYNLLNKYANNYKKLFRK